ncbi:hypothetical protein [Pseudooceanicola aestuarii]|nr:hypothetical protein [Pseudooceanicola aestuarii]
MSSKQKKWVSSLLVTAQQLEAQPLPHLRAAGTPASARLQQLRSRRRAVA